MRMPECQRPLVVNRTFIVTVSASVIMQSSSPSPGYGGA